MKPIRLLNPVEYRSYLIKQEGDWLILYDKHENKVKRIPNMNHGSLTSLKHLADAYIKESK